MLYLFKAYYYHRFSYGFLRFFFHLKIVFAKFQIYELQVVHNFVEFQVKSKHGRIKV